MTEESDNPPTAHEPTTAHESTSKEKAEATAATGAALLGCLGMATLPWSLIAIVLFIVAVVAFIVHVIAHQ